MTHSSAEEILARAQEIRFSRTVLTIVLWLFWLPGWIAGRAWLVLVFLALWTWHNGIAVAAVALRRGWRDGTGADEREARRGRVMTLGPDNSKV